VGYKPPTTSTEWVLEDALGRGGFSNAYSVRRKTDSQLCVMKDFRSVVECANERKILELLVDVGNVPKVEWFGVHSNLLIVSPVGARLLPYRGGCRTTGLHYGQLVDIVKAAHEKNIVHRDIKPGNIYLVGDNVLLNDWGSACVLEGGCSYTWVGTQCYGDRPAAEDDYLPSFVDDLRALTRTLYTLVYHELPPEQDDTVGFWNARKTENSGTWSKLWVHADSCDYDQFRAGACSLK